MKTRRRSLPATLLAALAAATSSALGADSEKKVPVDAYVMSLCPFGTQAENGLLPMAKSLAKHVDLSLYFIANEAPGPSGLPKFSSLHGEPEVQEDIRQVCAMKLFPGKYMAYILERNKTVNNPRWQDAAETVGIDTTKIEACAQSPQGAAWYSKSIQASQERGANSSPTIYIAGKPYTGGRSQAAFTAAVCDALAGGGGALPVCAAARAAAADDTAGGAGGDCGGAAKTAAVFNIWAVRDADCKACELTLLAALKRQHPGAVIKTLDADSLPGQALIAKHRARTLPLYALDRKVEEESNFMSLLDSQYARSADQYIVKPGPDSYIPSVQLTRKRVPRHLDIFVDPFSPFAARAEAELIDYLSDAKIGDLTFSMHFLVHEGVNLDKAPGKPAPGDAPRSASLSELFKMTPGPLATERGEIGLKESRLQACLFQHDSMGVYFTYLACRNKSLQNAEAPDCLRQDDRLATCMTGPESDRLLRYDARLERELGVNTSFAVLWENRYGPFGWHDVDWKRLIEARP